jgi:hypothetical protein
MKSQLPTTKVPGAATFGNLAQTITKSSKRGLPQLDLKQIAAILITFMLSLQFASAQKIDTPCFGSPEAKYCLYMEKYKTNKTVGWLLLVSGATMMTIKGVINAHNNNNVFKNGFNPAKGPGLGIIGSAMALTSIPFFISAGNNKRKACLSLKREKIVTADRSTGSIHYLAIDLKIKF